MAEEKPELTEAELIEKVETHSTQVVHREPKAVVVCRLNHWKTAVPYFKRLGFVKNPGLIKESRDEATRRELQKVQRDPDYPCFKLLPTTKTHKYNLRNQKFIKNFFLCDSSELMGVRVISAT